MVRDHYVKAGTDKAGYEVWVELDKMLIRIHLWGIWDEPLARQYATDCDARMGYFARRQYFALIDMKDAPIQTQEVKAIRAGVVIRGVATGVIRIAYLTSNLLALWQAQRMARASGCKEAEGFATEADALAWLRNGGPVGGDLTRWS